MKDALDVEGFDSMSAGIYTDCRDDKGTKCSLAVGQTKQGDISANRDTDWWKASLRQGRTYVLSLTTHNYCEMQLLDRNGRLLKRAHSNGNTATISYKAGATAPYFLKVIKGTEYTVGLK